VHFCWITLARINRAIIRGQIKISRQVSFTIPLAEDPRRRPAKPHEAGLKLLSVPRAPKEMPASALIRNAHGIAEWKMFVRE
jgi:hypothetical protein